MEDAAGDQCPACGRPGPSWHGTGPWLIVHAGDIASIEQAGEVVETCRLHGIADTSTVRYDEAPRRHLWAFTAVIFILPSATEPDVRAILSHYAELLDVFRNKRDAGLREIDRVPRYLLGAVLWVGSKAVLDNPVLALALRRSDARFYVENGQPDIFNPFERGVMITETREPVYSEDVVQQVFEKLATWGIRPEDVDAVKFEIETWREKFDSTSYSVLNGQRDGLGKNRFEIVLDGPGDTTLKARLPPERWNSFVNEGSRACRTVLAELATQFPQIHSATAGRPITQKKIRDLYRLLRAAKNYQAEQSETSAG